LDNITPALVWGVILSISLRWFKVHSRHPFSRFNDDQYQGQGGEEEKKKKRWRLIINIGKRILIHTFIKKSDF